MGNPNPDIHKKLIAQCRRGDARSQHRLYKLYARPMYNICMRMLANKMDAEDVMQEAFVAAFRRIEDYRGEASFGSWLRRIIINHCINFLQRQRKFFESLDNAPPDAERTDDEEADYQFPPEVIHGAVKSLPEGSRVVLNLYLFEGYKHREIAKMTGISESTSKSQYKRAKILLKERLLNYEARV